MSFRVRKPAITVILSLSALFLSRAHAQLEYLESIKKIDAHFHAISDAPLTTLCPH
jgi:hypothetical protein